MLFKDIICDSSSEVEAEISECRQDERDSQNQILQVIAAAATVLSVIFGSSTLSPNGDSIQRNSTLQHLFYLNITVFCAAMPYTTTLGIVNVLRFQYIRALEDYLAKKNPNSTLIRWMSFSSPITTRNLMHIGSPVTLFHFFCYNLATFSAILFCFVLTFAQYSQIPLKSQLDTFLFYFVLIIMLIISTLFIFTCLNAEKMAIFCAKKSVERRNLRLSISTNQDFTCFIKYIIYPRAKDFQKGALIIIGYLMGFFLFPSTFSVIDLKNILITWLVIEFLGYQARYQINDLRGICEDQSNRLPMPWKFAPISAMVALLRVLAAFIVAVLFGQKNTFSMVVCLVALILSTFAYEYVRIQYDNTLKSRWCIFILVLVSVGYPLRFIAGFWAAVPTFWQPSFAIAGCELSIAEKLLILLAFAFFGEFSVLFPWYYEANEQNKCNGIKKNYYHWLLKHKAIPLRGISLLISIIILLFLQLKDSNNSTIVIFEISIIVCTILVCLFRNPILAALASIGIFIVVGLWESNYLKLYYILLDSPYNSFIFLVQIFFIITYILMGVIFGPKMDLKIILKNILMHIFCALAGRRSIEWLKSQINDKDTHNSN